MPRGFAPRFAIEAGFLILLGAGSGYANLRTAVIVAVVAGGWLLVSLIELTVWRAQARSVGTFVPPKPEPEFGRGEVQDETAGARLQSGSGSHSPEEVDYPLRAGADEQPSEEIEAYTRVLGGPPTAGPPSEPGD
jgi:hypothetical protein